MNAEAERMEIKETWNVENRKRFLEVERMGIAGILGLL